MVLIDFCLFAQLIDYDDNYVGYVRIKAFPYITEVFYSKNRRTIYLPKISHTKLKLSVGFSENDFYWERVGPFNISILRCLFIKSCFFL